MKDSIVYTFFSKHGIRKKYPKESLILEYPSLKQGIVLIEYGGAKMYFQQKNYSLCIHHYTSSDTSIINLNALHLSYATDLCIEAYSDCLLLWISYEQLRALSIPDFIETQLRVSHQLLFNSLISIQTKISLNNLETNVYHYLSQIARFMKREVIYIKNIEIAHDLAADPVSISRVLKTLSDKGKIKRSSKKIQLL